MTVTKENSKGKENTFRIEYNTMSDDFGRCSFFLYWHTDYTPSIPYPHEKGQGFFADPTLKGFPRPEDLI